MKQNGLCFNVEEIYSYSPGDKAFLWEKMYSSSYFQKCFLKVFRITSELPQKIVGGHLELWPQT